MSAYSVKDNTLASGASAQLANQRKSVRLSTGRIYFVYVRSDGSYNQVYVAYSDNDGESWSEEAVTTSSVAKKYPAIAVDSGDKLHISYSTDETSGTVYYVNKTYGGSWSAPASISTYRKFSCIVVNSSDHIWILMYSSYHAEIREQHSTDGGANFSGTASVATGIASGSGDTGGLSVAVDGNDDIHVTFQWYDSGDAKNLHKYIMYDSSAGTWGSTEQIMDHAYDAYNQTQIAVDSNNVPHVVMADRGQFPTKERIYYANRVGGSWNTAILISDSSYASPECSIGIDLTGDIHVVFQGYNATTTTYYQIGYRKSTNGGTSFSSISWLTSGNTDKRYPDFIWGRWPIDGALKLDIPDVGYMLFYADDDDLKVEVSADLEWDEVEVVVQTYSDTGSGSETVKKTGAVLKIVESGAGSEGVKLNASKGYSDTGSGADSYLKFLQPKEFSDSGVGSEALLKLRLVNISDSGVGSEGVKANKTEPYLDSGVGSEINKANKVLNILDSGLGDDDFLFKEEMLFKDYGTGTDLVFVSYPYPRNIKTKVILIRGLK